MTRPAPLTLLAWLGGALLLAFWGIVLLDTFDFPASALDEGTLVAYPTRLLEGDVPHRDFQTLYGPANVWIVAAAFKIFGAGLGAERAVGLTFRLLALGSALIIGARFGRVTAVAAATLAAVVWVPWYAQANAALTALGLALAALALISLAIERSGRRATVLLALAGVAAGLAVLVRFDFLPAVALSVVAPLLVAREGRRAFAYGAGAMALIGLAHAVLIGPAAVVRVVQDILDSAPGRNLPVPGMDTDVGRLFMVSAVGAIAATAVGILGMRGSRDPRAALLAGLGLLAGGVIPYMAGRADIFHITSGGAVGCIAVACLLGYLAQRFVPSAVAGAVAVAIITIVLANQVTDLRNPRWLVEVAYGDTVGLGSVEVRAGDRGYRLFPEAAVGMQEVINRLQADARPGQRLYVGPRDLRYAEYNDAFLYYLLPQLEPASFYLEDNPETVNGPRHDLSADLRSADFLVLNSDHNPDVPGLHTAGSPAPNDVVRRDFCKLMQSGTIELFGRRRGRCG